MLHPAIPALGVFLFGVYSPLLASTVIRTNSGAAITLDESGAFALVLSDPAWTLSGTVGGAARDLATASGSDRLGDYEEITFTLDGAKPRRAAIRGYAARPVVMFRMAYPQGADAAARFPVISSYPSDLGHINYCGMFATPSFYAFTPESPWMFFDRAANAFVFSSIANFMTASSAMGANGEISGGMTGGIGPLPAGFEHASVLVFGRGINRTFDAWGNALTDYYGKQRPRNDADLTLARLGYWTDNGATYYYHTEPSMPYRDTLAAVKADFDRTGIALGYMQLDSWFYPKGANEDWSDYSGGIYSYTAAPALFGDNLRAFTSALNLKLVTHARWIDANSPYRQQYQMSNNVIIDPAYWKQVASYLAASGVATYEQDWLSDRATPLANLTDADLYLDNMAAAMAANGLTMQYCMGTPRHLMQASKYSNLTTARVSADRFGSSAWHNFLFASRLASALGIFPFSDVFMSGEGDNLLLATLSAGPVGIGDAVGGINTASLLRAVRKDGVIVKPDAPLVPLDSAYVNQWQRNNVPLMAAAASSFGSAGVAYVVAVDQGGGQVASYSPAEVGMTGMAYVYNVTTGSGQIAAPGDVVSEPLRNGQLFYVLAPVGPSGIAVLGDKGHFASLGKQRVTALSDDGKVRMSLVFAAGEGARIIHGYAVASPAVRAVAGAVGTVQYDLETQRFEVAVSPGADLTAEVEIDARLPQPSLSPGASSGFPLEN